MTTLNKKKLNGEYINCVNKISDYFDYMRNKATSYKETISNNLENIYQQKIESIDKQIIEVTKQIERFQDVKLATFFFNKLFELTEWIYFKLA